MQNLCSRADKIARERETKYEFAVYIIESIWISSTIAALKTALGKNRKFLCLRLFLIIKLKENK